MNQKQILCIEDEAAIVLPLRYALEREGWSVSWANTGTQALELLSQQTFDFIILDVGLPDLNGGASDPAGKDEPSPATNLSEREWHSVKQSAATERTKAMAGTNLLLVTGLAGFFPAGICVAGLRLFSSSGTRLAGIAALQFQ